MKPGNRAATHHANAFEQLSTCRFDLLVIGAGITGARIALEAARDGMRVALVDRGDIAGETSSASSKLIHGGFRYLSLGQFDLVRSASRERRSLELRADGLVRPLPMVIAVRNDGPYRPASVTAGVAAYALLAGRGERASARGVSSRVARRLVPHLEPVGLRRCAVLHESQTHDARLVLATARAAARHGAVVCTYCEAVELRVRRGQLGAAEIHDRMTGEVGLCRFRAVINAAGPWVDVVRRLDDPQAGASVRFSKGIHVTLPLPDRWNAGLIVPVSRGYAVHAVPWQGLLLVGTTDVEHDGPPAPVKALPGEISPMLEHFRDVLTGACIDSSRVLSDAAGLRALPVGSRHVRVARRDHIITESPSGLISVAGGKLTTHRLIARDALAAAGHSTRRAGLGRPRRACAAAEANETAKVAQPQIDGETLYHLQHLYGDEFHRVLELADAPDSLKRIHPAGQDVWVQIDHAIDREWALTVDDLVRRRTTLAAHGLATLDVRQKVAQRARLLAQQPAYA